MVEGVRRKFGDKCTIKVVGGIPVNGLELLSRRGLLQLRTTIGLLLRQYTDPRVLKVVRGQSESYFDVRLERSVPGTTRRKTVRRSPV